jgi:hypothetical protein
MIRDSKIMAPDRHLDSTKKLCAQLTSRRQKVHSSGKLWMETKEEMRARGVKSPDIADAFVIVFSILPFVARPYGSSEDSGPSQAQGWEYMPGTSGDDSYRDRRTWNRSPEDEGGASVDSGV